VIVRRQLHDQEWELLGQVDTYEKLLGHISIAVRVRKNDIHNFSSSAELRECSRWKVPDARGEQVRRLGRR
jgi:hypothetical protein